MLEQGIVPRDDPLPNVESLVTTWKILLNAEAPIAGVRTMLKSSAKRKKAKEEGFVDVVARGGEEWIRVYRCVSRPSVRVTSGCEAVRAALSQARRSRRLWPSCENKTR
jgi:hypothetical protein